jgi:3-methyladenine DNA glycosylase AlkD
MKKTGPETLLRRVRAALRAVADPGRAPAMQAYMKSAMPYHGVPAPTLRRVFRDVSADVQFSSAEAWMELARHIWREARFREERYFAIALCKGRHVAEFQKPAALPLYQEFIVTGAWWDFVDDVATHCIGDLLRRHPKEITRAMRAWSRSDNMWMRRASIICQVGFKKHTDLDLLYACIEPSLDSPEFFLRKAIGWALRQYAWTDPEEVRRYVRENEQRLSPLSRREALKNVGKSGNSGTKSGNSGADPN